MVSCPIKHNYLKQKLLNQVYKELRVVDKDFETANRVKEQRSFYIGTEESFTIVYF